MKPLPPNRVAGVKRVPIFTHQARAGDDTLPCGSLPGHWYCWQAERGREIEVRDRLEEQGFGAFLPLVLKERRHARRAEIISVAMFPGYGFVRMDITRPGWRSAAYTRGIRRIFGTTPERPTPVPDRAMAWLIAEGYDRPIVKDPRILLPAIDKDAEVRILEGPWADHRGVCLFSDERRVELALTLFGRETKAVVDRQKVEPVACRPS